ncbi:hypothetical protein [Streptomyces sp. NPDC006324]|uniref:hypothetical protein n=1 Tax=Streptomyces sp. NPDC006324 TaxID=3156751 RepID=UPI00339F59D6
MTGRARNMTFTTNGDGNSTASGIISSVGSSMSSMFGGYQPAPGGAGFVGGGRGYTQALEDDNANVATSGSNSAGGGSFWGKAAAGLKAFGGAVAGPVGLGLQVAAAAKDTLESTAQNTAANAGLGPAASGGRHVVIPSRGSGGVPAGEPEAPAQSEEGDSVPAPEPAPAPAGESAPPPVPDSGPVPASVPSPDRPAPDPPTAVPTPSADPLIPVRPTPPAEPPAPDASKANWHGPRPAKPQKEGS